MDRFTALLTTLLLSLQVTCELGQDPSVAEVVGEVRLAATGELLSHVAAAANRSALEIAGLSPGDVCNYSYMHRRVWDTHSSYPCPVYPLSVPIPVLFFGCYFTFSARIMDISRIRSPGAR